MTAARPADTAGRLAELEALHAAATPGEWVHNPINGIHTPIGSCIAITQRHDDEKRRADAALIVAAVNAVPELVAALRSVLALADELDADAVAAFDAGAAPVKRDLAYRYSAARIRAAVASALDRGPE